MDIFGSSSDQDRDAPSAEEGKFQTLSKWTLVFHISQIYSHLLNTNNTALEITVLTEGDLTKSRFVLFHL